MGNEGSRAEDESALLLEISADSVLGYASVQNDVPVVRSIQIRNRLTVPLANVELTVACHPAFAKGARYRFDVIGPSESRRLAPVDLLPEHSYLSALNEAEHGSIVVRATNGETPLAEKAVDVEIMAYDQWAGTRLFPELLAAFSMPNAPVIDQVLSKASQLLRTSNSGVLADGYQSKNRDNVWGQISAIYSVLAAEGIQYAEPPASFGDDGQKIRTPERILTGRLGTCLDLAMLFASCLEQAGLHPVVLFKKEHAWVACWLVQTSFGTPVVDDVQAIRKRVQSGELLAFETTGIASQSSPSLRTAATRGQELLFEEDSFRYGIDIRRARELRIRPLPSREAPRADGTVAKGVPTEPALEPAPELPPLDPSLLPAVDAGPPQTPEGRLGRWKSKLLDLTLRNRLLNFKHTKSNLQLASPDLAAIEDRLAAGRAFRLRWMPRLMEGDDTRDAMVSTRRMGSRPIVALVQDALERDELILSVEQDQLEGRLLELSSTARTGLEEGGANTLFLALGMLRWMEDVRAEASHLAPILLVPVSLDRESVRSGFKLTRLDDETIVNPTLLEKLATDDLVRLPAIDALPVDDSGVDVKRVLQTFRLAISESRGWEVLEEAHLGIFSFTKYLMWKDLQARVEALKTNRVVAHLINNPGEAFSNEAKAGDGSGLDESHRPQDSLAPMLSDSSQLNAICSAGAGLDLVLEGPPGTGKSQTITNLIAHFLGTGRTVLFVSEKMAALDVVHRRLNDIGLGPFCLELHSAKARKLDVISQLGRALDFNGSKSPAEWEREAERLASLRQELNGFVDATHRPRRNELTVFEATGTAIRYGAWSAAPMPWADAEAHDRKELESLRETVRQMAALASDLSNLAGHPLALVEHADWSPTWQDDFLECAAALESRLRDLEAQAGPLLKVVGMPDNGPSMRELAALDGLADALLGAPRVSMGVARRAHDGTARSRLQTLQRHGVERQCHWESLGGAYTDDFARLKATELDKAWSEAVSTWWPKSWLAKRAVTGRLAMVRTDKARPPYSDVARAISILSHVNDEDRALDGMRDEASRLLGESFAGTKTDWSDVARQTQWAKSYSDAVVRMGGGDVSAIESLKARLEPYVANNRAMLAPNGAIGSGLVAYRDAFRQALESKARMEELACSHGKLAGPDDAAACIPRVRGILQGWVQASRILRPWCLWRKVRGRAVAQGLHGVVSALENDGIALDSIVDFFEYSYQTWWLKKTIDTDPLLRTFSSSDHIRKIREFQQTDARFQQLTQQYIVARLASGVPSSTAVNPTSDSEMGRLRREMAKQRRHIPVRQLVQGLPTLLPRIKPCLLMSPLSVAQYLDTTQTQFDLVVFDEASQIPVWDAVGAIARGRQLVVVGDPKQLPPTNFFNRTGSDEVDAGSDEVEDLESILDECLGAGLRTLRLQWHYRSRHESLITFSNVNYYESKLITFPSPVTDDIAVRFERVNGVYDRGGSRTNRIEAQTVVDWLERHFLDADRVNQTIGVVTFNQTQQTLIDSLLDARRRQNSALDRAIAARIHEPLFVKNLENVQGDERDIIYFSITYGADAAGRTSMNFGPLNMEGGHRRLNVAISRAREGIVIFSSLMPEQIDLSRVRAAGVRDLKSYLEFAIRGPRALVEQSVPTGREPDSPFEEAVIQVLRERGWSVHPQVGCSAYRIDLAVVDPRAPGRYLLGIECDGRTYHSGITARDRDRLRQSVLEGLGWRLHRIWSTDWWTDARGQTDKLLALLEGMLQEDQQNNDNAGSDSREGVHVGESVEPVVEGSVETMRYASVQQLWPAVAGASSGVVLPSGGEPESLSPRAYCPASLDGGSADAFYDVRSVHQLRRHLLQVIEAEGPVSDDVLFRRVARVWGLERTGSRIVEKLTELASKGAVKTIEGDTTFYWPSSITTPGAWGGFRVADESEISRRHVAQVCLEEIANLAGYVLEHSGSLSVTDLARTVCRMFGMARTPGDAEARVGLALARMQDAGRISIDAGRVVQARTAKS